jgi:hypothetical protein
MLNGYHWQKDNGVKMRNSNRKTLRRAIKKLSPSSDDILITRLPDNLRKSLWEFLSKKYQGKAIAMINLVDEDHIEIADKDQLIELKILIDTALEKHLNQESPPDNPIDF